MDEDEKEMVKSEITLFLVLIAFLTALSKQHHIYGLFYNKSIGYML
jgi:hypothetical protein